jgi:hypothetical protein
MQNNLVPTIIRNAVADPKVAGTATLEMARDYVDSFDPADFEMVEEELDRREGTWIPPEY